MKKILYIATTADNRNRLDGETIKCRLLRDYLNEMNDVKVISVDTDDWKKHILKLVITIIISFFRCDNIIVSSADNGAHIVLDFFRKIKTKKNIYYFVVGGALSRNIKEKKWNIKTYKNIKQIYVEANTLKEELNKLNINNVKVLSNFRKVKKFENKYKKTNEIKFVYFGRVIKEKGIEELLKVAEQLPYKLYIAGRGPLEDILKQKYSSDNIKFVGHLSAEKIIKLFKKVQFSVVPSIWYENNPLSAIESLCCGTPVCGRRIGGIPELLENDADNRLFSNEVELITSLSDMFISSSEVDRQKLSSTSCERFSAEQYYRKWLELAQSI